MKNRKKGMMWCLMFVVLMSILFTWNEMEDYHAATSYDNAMEFFHSTDNGDGKHIEVVDGTIYFGTRAKLAKSRSGHKYYNTLGYDVTLSGNGRSVTFAVKRGGSLEEVPGSVRVDKSGYEYLLYRIPTNTIFALASKADQVNAKEVLKASVIDVRMDAIVTIRQNGVQGNVVEDGKGGLTETAPVYHLKNSSHLNSLRDEFSGHLFETYIKILGKLYNYQLSVIYAVNGTPEHIASASTTATVGSDYKKANYKLDGVTVPHVLWYGNGPYKSTSRVVNEITILNPSAVGMNKAGYHLDTDKEWITAASVPVSANTQMSKEVAPDIGYGDRVLVLYANWKPNTFTIQYDANGGSGTMGNTNVTYGTSIKTTQNKFTQKGHTFMGWYLYRASDSKWLYTNGSSTGWYTESNVPNGYYKKTYANGASVSTETDVHKDTITFYAQWSPNIYTITLDSQGADTAGTTVYYEKYSKGNYTTSACSATISTISKPEKKGYTFKGYYTGKDGTGNQQVNASGTITASNPPFTAFNANTTLYASWEANRYTIKYNANGGSGFMEDIPATYGEDVWLRVNRYTRTGYTFNGWAITSNGDAVYKDKATVSNLRDRNGDSITLYAVWEPIVVHVKMDSQGGSGGTDSFWQKYEKGFFSSEGCTSAITGITIPVRTGYALQGFWDNLGGKGTPILSPLGVFLVENTHFLYDTVIYADWEAKNYTVTFDKQLGNNGTDSAKATYDKLFPMKEENGFALEAPTREGYQFMGYFTEKNGVGQVYNEHMATDVVYKYDKNITLYAHWLDDILPEVELNVSSNVWTNQEVELTAIARDYGVGLSSVVIYHVAQDGTETQVASATGLNGAKYKELTFNNKTEGGIRYKAVATDMEGNSVESYNVVYYDKTKPSGVVIDVTIDENVFSIELDVTDINIGD